MVEPTSNSLWRGVAAGLSNAEEKAYQRYAERLLSLVQAQMSAGLRRRVDPEDVVLSAYRSMFRGVREGRFHSQRSGAFWSLLARMALNKLRRQIEQNTAAIRDVRNDRPLAAAESIAAREATAEEMSVAAELLGACYAALDTDKRQVLQLRLEDHTLTEIAERVGRTERTVRRWLHEIREAWECHAGGGGE